MAAGQASQERVGQESTCIAFGDHPSDAKLCRFIQYNGRSNEETVLAEVERRDYSCIARCKGKHTRVAVWSLMFHSTTC